MNNRSGISTTASSITIGFFIIVLGIGGFFVFQYLSQDPIEQSIVQTLKIEHSLASDSYIVTVLNSDGTHFRAIITSKTDGSIKNIIGKYENNTATFFHFGNQNPTCELSTIHNVSKLILGNCKIFDGDALTVDSAKDKLNDDIDDSFSIIGFINFDSDPSNGKTTITSGNETLSLPSINQNQVPNINNNDVVVVKVSEKDGDVKVNSIKSLKDDEEVDNIDTTDDSDQNEDNEPYSKSPPEDSDSIYDLNQAGKLRLLND